MKTLLIIFLILNLPIFSQEKTRTIVISNNGEKTKIEVDNKHKKLKTKTSKTYYWLKSKKVLSTQGAYQGSLLHGIYESNYKNHQLKSQGIFKYGLKTKTWKYWDQQGVLQKTETWKNGILIETLNYKNGSPELSPLPNKNKKGLKLNLRKKKVKKSKDKESTKKEKEDKKEEEQQKSTKKTKNTEESALKENTKKEVTP